MADLISAVEDAVLAHLASASAALPYKLIELGSYAGQLDEQLDQVIRRLPAVWIAFAGASRPKPVGTSKEKFRVEATWAVMHGARNVRGEKYTRHSLEVAGQILEVGAYRILHDVAGLLLRQDFGLEIEPLIPGKVTTLYNTRLASQAMAVFAQEWHTAWILTLPAQPLDPAHPDAIWETLGIDYHLQPDDGRVDARDDITLAAPDAYSYRWAHWDMAEGDGRDLHATTNADPLPAFRFNDDPAPTWGPSTFTLGSNGNRMNKVFGHQAVDSLFRLDDLPTQDAYKIKYWAIRMRLDSLPATTQRGGQYGDQGSATQAGVFQRGGWVWRINGATSPAPFTPYCVSFTIHTPYHPTLGKPGIQSDPNFVDPLATDTVPLAAGQIVDFVFAVDASRADGKFYAMIIRDGALAVEDVTLDPINFPLPGISDVTINGSSGLRLFAQSDATGQAVLKNATIWDVWVGEARDTAHVMQIAARLHADPSSNPY